MVQCCVPQAGLPGACRDPQNCPKNHLKHSHDTLTGENQTVLHLEHWKNGSRLGPVDLPVAPEMVEVWELIEGASAFMGQDARGIWFPPNNYALYGQDGYEDAYFSQIISKALSVTGEKVAFVDVRSLWITAFSDYVGRAELSPQDVTAAMLKEAAASLCGNSTKTWLRSYDVRAHRRGYQRVMGHYPAFKQFVKEQHAHAAATVARNPITGELG
jgi:hypothetical protein